MIQMTTLWLRNQQFHPHWQGSRSRRGCHSLDCCLLWVSTNHFSIHSFQERYMTSIDISQNHLRSLHPHRRQNRGHLRPQQQPHRSWSMMDTLLPRIGLYQGYHRALYNARTCRNRSGSSGAKCYCSADYYVSAWQG
jgi:hypothetical protein